MGVILTTYKSWDDPPSTLQRSPLCHHNGTIDNPGCLKVSIWHDSCRVVVLLYNLSWIFTHKKWQEDNIDFSRGKTWPPLFGAMAKVQGSKPLGCDPTMMFKRFRMWVEQYSLVVFNVGMVFNEGIACFSHLQIRKLSEHTSVWQISLRKLVPCHCTLSEDRIKINRFESGFFSKSLDSVIFLSKLISHLLTTYWIISLGIQGQLFRRTGSPSCMSLKDHTSTGMTGCPGYWIIPTRSFKPWPFYPLAGGHLTIKKRGSRT